MCVLQNIVKVDSCFTSRYLIARLSRLTEVPEDMVGVNVNNPSYEPQTTPCKTKIRNVCDFKSFVKMTKIV